MSSSSLRSLVRPFATGGWPFPGIAVGRPGLCGLLLFMVVTAAFAQSVSDCSEPVSDSMFPPAGPLYEFRKFRRETEDGPQTLGILYFIWGSSLWDFRGEIWTPVIQNTEHGTEVLNKARAICGYEWAEKYVVGRTAITGSVLGQAAQRGSVSDLNRDGNPDLINVTSTGIRVQFLSATGTLSSTRQIAVGFQPEPGFSKVVVADFNRDGKDDMAVTSYGSGSPNSGAVGIVLGNGDGTFGAPRVFPAGPYARALAAADFNGDGKLDLATGHGVAGGIAVLHGKGDGTFEAPTAYTSGRAFAMVALDLNADGSLDLAVAGSSTISVLPGAGNGSFGAPLTTAIPFNAEHLAFADFNHDGKLDLVIACRSSNALVMLLGNGNGTFQPPASYAVGNYPSSVAVSQGTDGYSLLFTGDSLDGAMVVTVVKPDGTIGAPRFRFVGGNPAGVVAADLNGDGRPDVVTANGGIAVQVWQVGDLLPAVQYALPDVGAAVAAGDLNGDGKIDIVAAGGASVNTLLGNGNGTLQTPVRTTVNENTRSLALADFNGDGKLDAVAAAYGSNTGGADQGAVPVLMGRGDGTFQTPVTLTAAGLHPVAVAAGDLNGDGKPDLAVLLIRQEFGSDPATLAVYLNQGNWTFAAARTLTLSVKGFLGGAISIGDVNGDGKPDLVLIAQTSKIGVLLGDGAGNFRETAPLPVTEFGDTALALADLNRDGKLDIVVMHCCGETDGTYLLGNGDGTFQTEKHLFSGSSPRAVAVTKFPGSRGVDLVIAARGEPGTTNSSIPEATGTVVLVSIALDAPVSSTPTINSPAVGSKLGSGTITFTWGAVSGATKYKLEIGSSANPNDLFSQETTATSLAVSNLPADGRTLYVKLSAFINGAYQTPATATYVAFGAAALRFVPLTPCRVMETRALYNFEGRTGSFGPPNLNAGEARTLNLPLSNVCSIPSTAKAYVVNVTLIPRTTVDSVTVYPAGESRPNVWTVRSPDGQIVANSAIVKAGTNGGIAVYVSDAADMLLDISGYFTDNPAVSNLAYYPMNPCRVIDTRALYRSPAGPFGPPSMTAGQTRHFQFPNTPYCSIPSGAAAYSVTLTAVPPQSLPYLTAWPTGGGQPNVSSINSFAGRVLANNIVIPASTAGSIDVLAYAATDFIMDINGYFAPDNGSGLFYFPVTQCRVSDTRSVNGTFGGPIMPSNSSRTIPVPSAPTCSGVPSNAQAYAISATAIPNGSPMPFLTMWATGTARPNASMLNAFEGQTVTNSAIVLASGSGAVDVYAYQQTHVVLDLSGYFGR